MKVVDTVQVFSRKLNRYVQIEVDPSADKLDAIQQTGAGTRMLVPDSPEHSQLEQQKSQHSLYAE